MKVFYAILPLFATILLLGSCSSELDEELLAEKSTASAITNQTKVSLLRATVRNAIRESTPWQQVSTACWLVLTKMWVLRWAL